MITTVEKGPLIIEGKTKRVYPVIKSLSGKQMANDNHENMVIVESKDDITAGDGARHDVIPGKAAISNATTIAVFKLLAKCGIPLAFVEGWIDDSFIALECAMLPFEVVVRREAHGSYCKSHPDTPKGTRFPKLLVQFYLKTSDKRYGDHELPCDDPLIEAWIHGHDGFMKLYRPNEVPGNVEPFLTVPTPEGVTRAMMTEMAEIAAQTFLVLEEAWQQYDMRFVDDKVEFGLTTSGRLVLSDVIDADSCRIVDPEGNYLDKQVYRDGGTVDAVFKNYLRIQRMVEGFSKPTTNTVGNSDYYELG